MSTDNKRYYIGVRTSKVHPSQDNYFGSFTDKTFKPTHKRILGLHINKKDALNAEIYWHNLFEVGKNPLFANRAKQTSTGFDRTGAIFSKEHRSKISKATRGKKLTNEHKEKLRSAKLGKKFTKTHKEAIRRGQLGRKHSQKTKNLIGEKNSGNRHGRYDSTKYLFLNKEGMSEHLTAWEFRQKYNCPPSSISELKSGKRRAWKNWLCTCII